MDIKVDTEERSYAPILCSNSEDFKSTIEFPQIVPSLNATSKEEPVEWLITDVRSLAESQPEITSAECIGSETFIIKVEQCIKEESDHLLISGFGNCIANSLEKEIKKEEETCPTSGNFELSGNESVKKESDSSDSQNVKPLKQELEEKCVFEQGKSQISETSKLTPEKRRSGRLSCKIKQSGHKPSPKPEIFFKCETCDKVIKRLGSFREHQRIHTGERPYKCKVCKKNFKSCADLIKHGLVHSNRRPHKCKKCGKKFKLAGDLSKHSKVHSDQFPFKCESCDKSFKRTSCLIKHMRIHTEEKPFACPICGKRFKWESSVREHRRIHSGEKPFQCPECKKKFTHFSTFQQHKRTHKENAAFSCDICDKSFNHKSNLLKHKRNIHT
ncbi:zinc finger protein 682-like [Pelobates fuscus]|uniref:zinc finger protein 682-like n=1 Tax=Pelobates fuscus TaxID=191477 RepID=UPI002FE4F52E